MIEMRYLSTLFKKINSDPYFKEMIKGSSYVLFFRLFGVISGYVFFLTIANKFESEAVGLFNISFSLLSICLILGRLGLDNAIVRFIAESVEKANPSLGVVILKKCLKLVLPLSIVLSMGYFFSSSLLANFFDNESLIIPFKLMSLLVVPFSFIMIISHVLRGYKFLREFSYFQNGTFQFIAVILIFIFSFFTSNQYIVEYSFLLAVLIGFLFAVIFYLKKISPYKSYKKQNFDMRAILVVAVPMFITGFMFTIMNWTDTLVLGYYLKESDVGIYNIAYKVSLLISIALFAINSMTAPQFAQLNIAGKYSDLRKLAKQTSFLNTIVALPIFIIVLLFSVPLLSLFGKDFIGGNTVLLILSFSQFFNAICGSVINFLNMTGKEKVVRNIITLAVILNLSLNLILVPMYNIKGAAIATALSMFTWNFIAILYVRCNYGFWMLPIKQHEG